MCITNVRNRTIFLDHLVFQCYLTVYDNVKLANNNIVRPLQNDNLFEPLDVGVRSYDGTK